MRAEPGTGIRAGGETLEDALDGAMSRAMEVGAVSQGAFATATVSAAENRERVRAERRRASRHERVLKFLRVS